MSSTNFNVGVAVDSKPSSRVLNPPGGVSSNIFGGPDKKELHPRNFKNQQNSSSMNEVMGTTDPNILINQKAAAEKSAKERLVHDGPEPQGVDRSAAGAAPEPAVNQRVRVPPGGFSSGLW